MATEALMVYFVDNQKKKVARREENIFAIPSG
jgi:hypothetical protein